MDVKVHLDCFRFLVKNIFVQQDTRNTRMNKKDTKQHLALSDQVNIGLKPANGLKPPKPDLAELDQDLRGTYMGDKTLTPRKRFLKRTIICSACLTGTFRYHMGYFSIESFH